MERRNSITPENLEQRLKEAVPMLLSIAKDSTWNKFSPNYKFLLAEARTDSSNVIEENKLLKNENDAKVPVVLEDVMPQLLELYDDLHEINLEVYRSTRNMTVIDIRYITKSSLPEFIRTGSIGRPPNLHCKVYIPNWIGDGQDKKTFDINWKRRINYTAWHYFWWRLKNGYYYNKYIKRSK